MKKILFLLFWGAFWSLSIVRADQQLLDRVIAVVNDEVITLSELDALLRPFYEEYSKELEGQKLFQQMTEVRRKLLNQLIEDRLVFQEAKRLEIVVDADEVEDELTMFKEQFPDEATMEKVLQEQGVSLSEIRERFRRQAMIRRLHDMEVRSKVIVSPLAIEQYYEEHPEEFSERESVKVRSITIKKSPEAREKGLKDEEAWQKIQDLRQRMLAGEDFGDLAKGHSEDVRAGESGLSEWVEQGAMIPAVDEVIFSQKIGEISPVVETSMGYHLFRVEDKREGSQRTLDEVRGEIHEKLFRKKSQKQFEHWMTELKRNAYISVH